MPITDRMFARHPDMFAKLTTPTTEVPSSGVTRALFPEEGDYARILFRGGDSTNSVEVGDREDTAEKPKSLYALSKLCSYNLENRETYGVPKAILQDAVENFQTHKLRTLTQ
jgi:hypothetical protein